MSETTFAIPRHNSTINATSELTGRSADHPVGRRPSGRVFTRRLGRASPPDIVPLRQWLAVILVSCKLALVAATTTVLATTDRESPPVPFGVWVFGHALLCLLNMGIICFDSRRRRRQLEVDSWRFFGLDEDEERRTAKTVDYLNLSISAIWWVLGLYWIIIGGETFAQDAPLLYGFTVVFLVFDALFVTLCLIFICILGITVCCCLPWFPAIFNADMMDEDATNDYIIRHLPKHNFRQLKPADNIDLEMGHGNSVCSICLSQYEDGVELSTLPCSHHFHSNCIIKWLRMKPICPLCKYNLLNNGHV